VAQDQVAVGAVLPSREAGCLLVRLKNDIHTALKPFVYAVPCVIDGDCDGAALDTGSGTVRFQLKVEHRLRVANRKLNRAAALP
jgi:hypothetical protein